MPRVESARAGRVSAAPVRETESTGMSRAGIGTRVIVGLPESIVAAATGLCIPLVVLLLLSHFSLGATLPLGLVGAAVAVWVNGAPDVRQSRAAVGWTLSAVAFLAAWIAYNIRYTAQDVYATRDPATYTITGRWLVDHSSLVIHTTPDVFGSPPHAAIASGSYAYIHGDILNAQGNHLLPALLGLFGSLFGAGAIFKVNVVIGALALLVFFALVRRLVNASFAMVAMAALGFSMPYLYVSRDTFTEPLTMLFLMGSLTLLHRAFSSWRTADFALAGLAAGCAAMVRIDSYLAMVGVVVAAGTFVIVAPAGRRRAATVRAAVLLGGAVVTALLGWLDLVTLSRQYYGSQRHNILAAFLLVFLVVLLTAVIVGAMRRPALRARMAAENLRRHLSTVLVVILVGVFALLASRPAWMTTHGARNADLENMQRRWGAAVDGTRTYNEQTVHWLALYLGWPTVAAAVAGYALMIGMLVRRRAYVLCGVLAMGLSMSAVYLWNSEITPDQPWAMRRYVPVVLPLLLLATAWAMHAVWRWRRARLLGLTFGRTFLRTVVVAIGAFAVVFPLVTSYPMRHVREENHQLAQLQAICGAVGPHGAIVLIDDLVMFGYGQAVRSYCNVPAIELADPSPAQLSAVNHAVIAHGRKLFVLSQITTPQQIAQITKSTGLAVSTFSVVDVPRWPNQINVAPTESDRQRYSMFLAAVDTNGIVHPVPPVNTGS